MALQSWQHRRTREGSSRRRPSHADDEDCEFADPFVSFNGRKRFEDNLANLAGGFITEYSARPLSSKLEGLSYKTKLMVKLRLALPWSPVLAWPWGVEHVLEERDDGTVVVVRHLESRDVSAGEGVRQLFRSGPPGALTKASSSPRGATSSSKAAPSPLGTKDPIAGAASASKLPFRSRVAWRHRCDVSHAGPLVAAARAVGVLPEQEEDGWAGEPSAWAESDSFTQKLSAFTQRSPERLQAVRGRTGRGRVRRGCRRGHRGGLQAAC